MGSIWIYGFFHCVDFMCDSSDLDLFLIDLFGHSHTKDCVNVALPFGLFLLMFTQKAFNRF